MSQATLEQRVERLERIVEELRTAAPPEAGRDDWRATVGMFADDPLAKEVIDEALRLRAEEREHAAP